MSGYFAVYVAEYEDMNWGVDVVQTGIGRYKTFDEAEEEAKEWALSEGIPYI